MQIIQSLRKKGYKVQKINAQFVSISKDDLTFHCIGLKQIKAAAKLLNIHI